MARKLISRRDFLKNTTLASLGCIYLGVQRSLSQEKESSASLGRILFALSYSNKQPDLHSQKHQLFQFNDLVNLYDPIMINSKTGRQEIWHRLSAGDYIPATSVQVVKMILNNPVESINRRGQLAEITVPYTTAWASGATKDKGDQIFFYGSTHWINMLAEDREGKLFYRVREDRWRDTYYVEASHMSVLPNYVLAPKRKNIPVDEKWLQINLREQFAVAYEGSEPVFLTKISSGQFTGDIDLATPIGEFMINYKRPSRHMVHSDRVGINNDELYGVPWVSYFTDNGIAFHGTYWHNDFSIPRSHGCINLPIEAARWIYLWTLPVVPPGEEKFVSNKGTSVEVL